MEFLTVPVGPLACNCYILWKDPESAIVIDPGDEADKIVRALEAHRLRPQLLVNTHGHFDHVGAVTALRERYRATYKIHEADLPILQMIPARTKIWGITVPDIPRPSEFVRPPETFGLAGLKVDAIHTPGHTPGSTCYRAPSLDAVFTGDTLFAGSIGRTDFPGGNMEQELTSIREQLLPLPPRTRVLPGHGPPTTIGDEAENNPFLQ